MINTSLVPSPIFKDRAYEPPVTSFWPGNEANWAGYVDQCLITLFLDYRLVLWPDETKVLVLLLVSTRAFQ